MEKYQDNFELEEMKQQIRLLKDKLAKETIISEKMMMQSTREKLAYINRNKNMFFIWMDYSWMFCVVTSIFLIAACLYQIYSHKGVNIQEISTDNLVDISKALIRMNRLGLKWLCFGLPFALLWIVWFIIESYPKESGESICIGGGVGFVAGAVIGLRYLKNERRKAKEAIRDIEEYTRED